MACTAEISPSLAVHEERLPCTMHIDVENSTSSRDVHRNASKSTWKENMPYTACHLNAPFVQCSDQHQGHRMSCRHVTLAVSVKPRVVESIQRRDQFQNRQLHSCSSTRQLRWVELMCALHVTVYRVYRDLYVRFARDHHVKALLTTACFHAHIHTSAIVSAHKQGSGFIRIINININ